MKSILKKLIITLIIQISFAQVNTETMRETNPKKEFRNKAKFDFGYEKSKDEIFDILFTLRSDYYIPGNLHSFLILSYQNGFKSEQDEKNIIINKGFGHLRITKQIFSNLDIEFFSQVGFNDFLSIKERKLYGTGLRATILEKNNVLSFIGTGMMKEREVYDINDISNQLLNRLTNYLTIDIDFNDDISFKNISYYQPSIINGNDFRFLLDNEIRFKINNKSSINMTINFRFDNEPHGDLVKSYFQINNGFELVF
ncbi:DUF481 domain-containing protein [Candidatus Marinimicrobia bacterium]|nr:DUF481 domain-containing protein [Candidatus Neomarinimicrobiota bacterium]